MREPARLNQAKRSDAHERAAKQQGRGHDPRKSRPKDARSHSRSLKRAGESKSLRVAHPICAEPPERDRRGRRSEEHTSELQSHSDLVCRLLLEKKKKKHNT